MRAGHPTKKLHVFLNFVGIIHAKNFQSRRSWVLKQLPEKTRSEASTGQRQVTSISSAALMF